MPDTAFNKACSPSRICSDDGYLLQMPEPANAPENEHRLEGQLGGDFGCVRVADINNAPARFGSFLNLCFSSGGIVQEKKIAEIAENTEKDGQA